VPPFDSRTGFPVAALLAATFVATLIAPDLRAAEPELTIAMRFDGPYSAASVAEMKREFARIMRPLRLPIAWRMLDDLNVPEAFAEPIVVRFRGNCEADLHIVAPVASRQLGLTHIISGDIAPFADVDCGSVRALMTQIPAVETEIQLEDNFGRGLAHVLAHEVYHAVLKTTAHGSRGIAKASLTPSELFSPGLRFAPDELERLSEALTAAPQRPNRPTVSLSIVHTKSDGTL
jgi:hypothetical protein